jgi:hypothetical protein
MHCIILRWQSSLNIQHRYTNGQVRWRGLKGWGEGVEGKRWVRGW